MSNVDNQNQDISLHKLATIGFVQSFGEQREFFYYRRDMSEGSLRFLIGEFVDRLNAAREEMVKLLPESIALGLESYRKKSQTESFKKLRPEQKAPTYRKISYLRKLLTLNLYSWNGETYDLTVMLGPLIERLAENAQDLKQMRVIKRGTSFMEIEFGFIAIRDFMNYTSPMSLGKTLNLL